LNIVSKGVIYLPSLLTFIFFSDITLHRRQDLEKAPLFTPKPIVV